ncbi:MAG: class I fructose-bisphosphate aldolase, partial [Patescibacteria group bacterium]
LAEKYRDDLLTTEGVESYVGGVILFPQTAQQIVNGQNAVSYLNNKGIDTFVKVDKGVDTDQANGYNVTKGFETMQSLLKEAKALGATGSKWRSFIAVADPANADYQANVVTNAEGLARYARANQDLGLIPIVEPEISYAKMNPAHDGGSHTIEESENSARYVLTEVVRAMQAESVDLSGIILKIGFTLPGKETVSDANPLDYQDIATRTLSVIRDILPADLKTVVFLSGGLTIPQSTECLKAINAIASDNDPILSASYGRGVQAEALKKFATGDHVGTQQEFLNATQTNASVLRSNK